MNNQLRKLIILKLTNTGFRAKDLDSGQIVSVKTSVGMLNCELNTVVLEVEKEWSFKKNTYLSGTVKGSEFIVGNINIPGHDYKTLGLWDPRNSFGEEAFEYFPDYLAEGLRLEYVFKDYSGFGFYEPDEDPVFDAVEADTWEKRYDILTRLWEDYPQCIDALVHIGNLYLDSSGSLENARNCFQVAISIAEKNLPKDFDGVILWDCLENRPYLRALHGLCLTQWRMKDFEKAYYIALRLMRLCPGDNLGVRGIIDEIANREEWCED